MPYNDTINRLTLNTTGELSISSSDTINYTIDDNIYGSRWIAYGTADYNPDTLPKRVCNEIKYIDDFEFFDTKGEEIFDTKNELLDDFLKSFEHKEVV